MNGWLIGMAFGTSLSAICSIGNTVSTKKKQENQFNDMCNDLTNQFCEKYDLEENLDDGTESL